MGVVVRLPSANLSTDPREDNTLRRHHASPDGVQRAVKRGVVRLACITKHGG